jgi:hypothetical protein
MSMLRIVSFTAALFLMLGCPLPVDLPGGVDEVPTLPPPCQGSACDGDEPVCLFGEEFRDLKSDPAFVLAEDEWIVDEAQLADAVERAQLISAVQQSTHTDVTTVAEALARVDEEEVRRIWFRHRASGAEYVVYEYGAGDNSYGAYFARGELDVLAQIHDGGLLECAVMRE